MNDTDPLNGLTPDQLRGVLTVGRSLLLSAAAGSGKTRVLAERCAYLVCDAPPEIRCDVDELLVVTFTEAAATEMRERIGKAILKRAQRSDDLRLQKQAVLVEQAQISTLHGFCSQLLRQHFHLIGLDPAFIVMDGNEASLLRLEIGRDLFRKRYDEPHAERFTRLLDGYFDGQEERLLSEVLQVYELSRSLVDPDAWLTDILRRVEESARLPVNDSELGQELIDILKRDIATLGQRCVAGIESLKSLGPFNDYVDRVSEIRQTCRFIYGALLRSGVDAASEFAKDIEVPRLKAVKNETPNKEAAKEIVDTLSREFKEGNWRTMLRFSAAEWQTGMQQVLPHVQEIVELVTRFGLAYSERKAEDRQLDFSDLERHALAVLREGTGKDLRPSPTARYYHRVFKQVLVDEYQDINALQNAILSLVSHECLNNEKPRAGSSPKLPPNLFSVGDVKQSIYRFRLADPEQFLQRDAALRAGGPTGEVIDLKENFRSRGPLLESINAIFGRLMTKESAELVYDDTQRLVPARKFDDPAAAGLACFPGAPIELHVLSRDGESPASADADADTDANDGTVPSVKPRSLAEEFARFSAWMAARARMFLTATPNCPARPALPTSSSSCGPENTRPTRSFASWSSSAFPRMPTAARASSNRPKCEISSPCWHCWTTRRRILNWRPTCAARSAGWTGGKTRWPRFAWRSETPGRGCRFTSPWRYAKEKDDALAAQLRDILAGLALLRQHANQQPVHEVIWSIYEQTGYLTYVAGLPGGPQRSANLIDLYEKARVFCSHRRQGLGRFLEFLSTLKADGDLGQASLASPADDVVHIMTVHASKGREFPIVIIPDLGKKLNLQDEAGPVLLDRRLGLGMPVADEMRFAQYPSLSQIVVKDEIHRKAVAEELRVLYVAFTRAMEHLILVGTAPATAAELWKRRWEGHIGSLPPATVVRGQSVLDWLGPVWAAESSVGHDVIHLERHALETIENPTAAARGEVSPWLENYRQRKPIHGTGEPDTASRVAIDRMSFQYPFEQFTKRPAARSVTALAKGVEVTSTSPVANSSRRLEPVSRLSLPRFVNPAAPLAATDRGTATHLVLQHFRFTGPADLSEVERQIAAMLASEKLKKEEAAAVDREAIVWFLGTDLATLIRRHEQAAIREMPVYVADSAETGLDAMMIRGRLDLYIPLPGDGVIIDYKTDNVPTAEILADRVATYSAQLAAYRGALAAIVGHDVTQGFLVFLRARQVVKV